MLHNLALSDITDNRDELHGLPSEHRLFVLKGLSATHEVVAVCNAKMGSCILLQTERMTLVKQILLILSNLSETAALRVTLLRVGSLRLGTEVV